MIQLPGRWNVLRATFTLFIFVTLGAMGFAPNARAVSAPVISVQPADLLANQNTHVQLTVELVNGGTGLNYQWWKNGHAIPGAIAFTLDFPSVQREDAGEYMVIISNPAGAVISRTATLQVIGLTRSLTDTGVLIHTDAVLTVETDTQLPVEFQWLRNGEEIPGATSPTLVIPSVTLNDTADFAVRLTDAAGVATNGPIRLTVYLQTEIIQQPKPLSIPRNGTGTLTVQAGGTGPWTYHWFKDGAAIPGATDPSFTISTAAYANTGNYYVVVSNPGGTVTSQIAAVAVGGPMITGAPSAAVVQEGASIGMNVTVTGEGTFTYQWLKNGVAIPGQTAASLSLPSVQLSDDADYSVTVTNLRGSATSAAGHLTVLGTPRIVNNLAPAEINLGSTGALRLDFLGSAPLKFQWFKDGQPIARGTNSTLVFTSAELTDAGQYSLRISNPLGNVTSASATLSIVAVPRITTPPANTTIREGIPFTLNVTAFSDGVMTFQWFKDGQAVIGATSSSLSISPGRATDSGSYSVQVSNLSGSVMSRAALVTVLAPPVITKNPLTQTVYEGRAATLTIETSGSAPFTYQWLRGNAAIGGATNAILEIAAVAPADAGSYSVRVSNGAGTVTSGAATLTVFAKPIITTPPANQSVNVGSPVFFTVQASGSGALSFQWFHNGVAVRGATIPALILSAVTEADLGSYTVRVSNEAGATESAPAILSPISLPVITVQPHSTNVLAGLKFSLAVEAVGTPTLTFQWFRNGLAIPGATAATFTVDAAQLSDAGDYFVEITNPLGVTRSSTITASVLFPVHFVTQPQGGDIFEGGTLTISVEAGGSGPISYQWLKNNAGIPGANGPTLTINNATVADAGVYAVSISNPVAFLLSDSVTVTVQHGNSDEVLGKLAVSTGSGVHVTARGIPGQTYDVQVASELKNSAWVTLRTVTVDASGVFNIDPPANSVNRTWFVRTVRH